MKIKSNFKKKSKELKKYAKELSRKHLKDAMFSALEEVANISVKDFMVQKSKVSGESKGAFLERVRTASTGRKLRTRTQRLAGSVVGNWRFSKTNLPKDVKNKMTDKQPFKEGAQESIREVKVSTGKFEGVIGSRVEYASIHEEGGVINHTNLFGKGIQATINIPKRPYLKPAVEASKHSIFEIFRTSIESTFERERI